MFNIFNIFKKKESKPESTLIPKTFSGEITQKIINNSNIGDPYDCIGHHTFVDALKKQGIKLKNRTDVSWINESGTFLGVGGNLYQVTTAENIAMVTAEQPQVVTFILKKVKSI